MRRSSADTLYMGAILPYVDIWTLYQLIEAKRAEQFVTAQITMLQVRVAPEKHHLEEGQLQIPVKLS